MTPAARTRRRTQASERLLAQAGLVAEWYARADDTVLRLSTRLAGWDVASIGAHLSVALTELATLLDRPSRERPLPQHRYVEAYASAAADIADKAARARGGDIASDLRRAVDGLALRIAGRWPDVVAAPRGPIRTDDFVAGRILELVVHSDDVNTALDGSIEPIPLDRQALGAATRAAAGILAERHPGASIEVRMPPVAAVQCASPDHPGPSHTRGTPPNVVEMEPLVFLRLATGRTTWAQEREARRISASGALADLSGVLPLLV